MEEKELSLIKILPYRGRNNEVTDGRKTIIKFFKDRIEYSVKYTEKVRISLGGDDEDNESIESLAFNEEDGVIERSSIIGIVKYVKTSYTEEMEPYNINYVDICSLGNSLTFSTENEADKIKLYNEVYQWKYRLDK